MEVDPEEVINSMERNAIEQRATLTCAGLENLLNPDGEDAVEEEASLESLGYEVAGVEGNEQCGDVDAIQEEEDTSLSTDEQLETLATA